MLTLEEIDRVFMPRQFGPTPKYTPRTDVDDVVLTDDNRCPEPTPESVRDWLFAASESDVSPSSDNPLLDVLEGVLDRTERMWFQRTYLPNVLDRLPSAEAMPRIVAEIEEQGVPCVQQSGGANDGVFGRGPAKRQYAFDFFARHPDLPARSCRDACGEFFGSFSLVTAKKWRKQFEEGVTS